MAQPNRPVWAEISSQRLLANYGELRELAGSNADLMPVVKADAYGHDVLACAPLLTAAGARWLGVTSTQEGCAVRAICPQPRILLMSGIFEGEAETVVDWGLTAVVWEAWHFDLLQQAGLAKGLPPGSIAVHLEIDTGMSRQGVGMGELESMLSRFQSHSCLRLEGVMTHFSSAETVSTIRPNPQLKNLQSALGLIAAKKLQPKFVHAGNSSTIVAGSDRGALNGMASQAGARLMLRPGLALYGYVDRITEDGVSWAGEPDFAPVLTWKTQVTSLRSLRAGETAGYGNTFVAAGDTRLALLPVGYADGFNRLLSNRGYVLIRGQAAPIAGRISMDQTTVDVTAIPGATIGDEVVLLGSQGSETLDAWDLAELCGTVPWEILCAIGPRVPRLLCD